MISPDTYKALGLSEKEYHRILKILGKEPTPTELAMFSVEWSEHCGYLCSKDLLKNLPKRGIYPIAIGEDSGAIFVDDLAIVFKMESHNHPSQIEPLQGAATGVGGIIRDIFTAGARPVASLNSLWFGDLSDPYNKHLLRQVVKGISWYGNCIGVPTIGGSLNVDESYQGNCLVNAMSIGVVNKHKLAQAKATGNGNTIMYIGSTTGRDGIGGCSVLASNDFEEGEAKRPTVQVGDPFTEKCLIEATLEIIDSGVVAGIKDMGAAGLTCAITEMAAAGGVGIDANLDRVPLRETGMEPWEIMMSESQERMLVCVRAGSEDTVFDICKKWGLTSANIGIVTENKNVRIFHDGKIVADISAKELTNPKLTYPAKSKPENIINPIRFSWYDMEEGNNEEDLLELLGSPNIASKKFVYEQYDHMVQANTVTLPDASDAAVIRLEGSDKLLAATTDCNSTYCYLNPYDGAMQAVMEAARNIACTGGKPIGATDCLNFGNPNKPDRFFQFDAAISGIITACSYGKGIPVVSGNVSFYNENPSGTINPTPTIGMIVIIDHLDHVTPQHFQESGQIIINLGTVLLDDNVYCEYIKMKFGDIRGQIPYVMLEYEERVRDFLHEAISEGLIVSAHDCAEGGLAVTLAECCFGNINIGADVNLRGTYPQAARELFCEFTPRVIISCEEEDIEEIRNIARKFNVNYDILGTTGGSNLRIHHKNETVIDLDVTIMRSVWEKSLGEAIS